MKATRSQLEIMGLVIIVILISIGLLFAVQFAVLNQSNDDNANVFTQERLADSMIDSLLRSTTNCNGLSLNDVIKECRLGGYTCNNGQDACTYSRKYINESLQNTINKWGKNYNLTAKIGSSSGSGSRFDSENVFDPISKRGCPREKQSATYPIPTQGIGSDIVVKLDICS